MTTTPDLKPSAKVAIELSEDIRQAKEGTPDLKSERAQIRFLVQFILEQSQIPLRFPMSIEIAHVRHFIHATARLLHAVKKPNERVDIGVTPFQV